MFLAYASDVLRGSPHNGRFYWGSGVLIAGWILTLVTGVLTLRLPAYEHDEELPTSAVEESAPEQPKAATKKERAPHRMPAGTETVAEEILPDGSRLYTTTRWNKNGTKTVTEEIVPGRTK